MSKMQELKLMGTTVWWNIQNMEVDEQEMRDIGLGHLIPKNDEETVLLKAIAQEKRQYSKSSVKSNDTDKLVVSMFVPVKNDSGHSLDREVTITLDKRSGSVSSDVSCSAWDRVYESYRNGHGKLNSTQIGRFLRNLVRRECFGVPLRKAGGFYFIDQRFEDRVEILEKFFESFSDRCKSFRMEVGNSDKNVAIVADAAKTDIFKDLDSIVEDLQEKFAKGEITKKYAKAKVEAAEKVFAKINVHRENLATELTSVQDRFEKISKHLTEMMGRVESGAALDPEDFMSELQNL